MIRFLGIIGLFSILALTSCETENFAKEQSLYENSTGGDDGEVDPGRGNG